MTDYFTYKIIPELKLIIEFGYGTLNYERGVTLKLKEIKDKEFDPTYSFLVVFTHCTVQLKKGDIPNYAEFVKKQKGLVAKRRSALLTNTPNHVVFNYLYREAMTEYPMIFEIFSTLPAALVWLGIPIEFEGKIKTIINDWVNYAT